MGSDAVSAVVARAASRCGLAPVRAHRLRHTASEVLRGAGFADGSRTAPAASARSDHGHLRQGRPQGVAQGRPSLAGGCPVSPLQAALSDYSTVRRTLGYKLERAEKLLGQFVAYLEERDMTTITVEHALTEPCCPVAARPGVRCGCRWCVASPPTCRRSIPPARCRCGTAAESPHRATPFLYSEEQVAALIEAAGRCVERTRLRPTGR